jgi:hypothetical protein
MRSSSGLLRQDREITYALPVMTATAPRLRTAAERDMLAVADHKEVVACESKRVGLAERLGAGQANVEAVTRQ